MKLSVVKDGNSGELPDFPNFRAPLVYKAQTKWTAYPKKFREYFPEKRHLSIGALPSAGCSPSSYNVEKWKSGDITAAPYSWNLILLDLNSVDRVQQQIVSMFEVKSFVDLPIELIRLFSTSRYIQSAEATINGHFSDNVKLIEPLVQEGQFAWICHFWSKRK